MIYTHIYILYVYIYIQYLHMIDLFIPLSTFLSRSPMHAAAVRGRAEIMQLLLSTRADANTSDDAGTTCMHFAADLGHARVAYHLLRAGADPSRRNGFGSRPIDKLVQNSWDGEAPEGGWERSLFIRRLSHL